MPVEDESSNLYPPAVSIPARSALAARPRRMPRIDELPIPAQNEIRARGEQFDSEPVKHLVTGRGVGGRDGEAPEPKPKPLLTEAERSGMPGTV